MTLFAANEIPSVVVTFVALIMFLQMKMGVAMSTLFSTLLLLPWVLQPLMRKVMPGMNGGRLWIHLTEILLTLVLGIFALTMKNGKWWTFGMLFAISILSTWHDLLARCYYRRRTQQAQEKYHSVLRTMSAQMATVLTYGLMIMAVGVLQIYFRQRPVSYSWSLGCYILSGMYMLMTLMNLMLLRNPGSPHSYMPQHWPWQRSGWFRDVAILMLMLLPQGLMFYSRTIFLLAPPQDGGLGCTLQEVGFAQGTIGVIAFLLGVTIGRWLQHRLGEDRLRWPLTFCLGLSPVVYVAMTAYKPQEIWMLSAYTFVAQILFGLGLNACRKYIEHISDERYQNAVNPVYIPIISLCILLPMVASGLLIEQMSFNRFFLCDALCAPIAWLLIYLLGYKHRLEFRVWCLVFSVIIR